MHAELGRVGVILGWCVLGAIVGACGGVSIEGNNHGSLDGNDPNGTGGESVVDPSRPHIGSGGASGVGVGTAGATFCCGSGAVPGNPYGDGGMPGYGKGGTAGFVGYAGYPVVGTGGGWGSSSGGSVAYSDAGAACDFVFNEESWSCRGVDNQCLPMDPWAWSPVGYSSFPDGGLPGSSVVEGHLCAPADPGAMYHFAVDISSSTYTSLWVQTGDSNCGGHTLAYLGLTTVGMNESLCFSVPGRFLHKHLAVQSTDASGTRVANLRPVSSCPCSYAIPYNVQMTCPDPRGSAGNPGCF